MPRVPLAWLKQLVLDCLRDEAPSHFVMVGSVTRADEPLPPTARLFLEELLAAGWRRVGARPSESSIKA